MTHDELLTSVRQRLKAADVSIEDAQFVDDDSVDYSMPERIYVRRSNLFSLEQHKLWERFLVPSPAWLHLNLLGCDEWGHLIISIRRSPRATLGAGTSINVSHERLPLTLENR